MSSLQDFQDLYVKPKPGRTLIVGSKIYRDKEDRRKRYPDAVGVDMLPGDGVDIVCNLEDAQDVRDKIDNRVNKFDHIECMSTLEHSRKPWLLAYNIELLMAKDATIFVSVPFCWRIHAYPDDYWRLTPHGVRSIFPNIEWQHLMLASDQLRADTHRIRSTKLDDHPYMARTETVGFGTRK
jgi:hypothetical protein